MIKPPSGPAPLLRHLPAVDDLKRRAPLADLALPEATASAVARRIIATVRAAVLADEVADETAIGSAVESETARWLHVLTGPLLRRVHNGLGVMLHTNAGRAPLPAASIDAIATNARGYCNLEFSLETGQRSSRHDHLRDLLCLLTGAEDAMIVNNGAAAVLLALHAIAAGRPVVVSRGELVEIGGGFRVPEVMAAAGTDLVEVGTTNRTHLRDYEQAIARANDADRPIAALLQVHRSNFEIRGFTATPDFGALADLAHRNDVPLLVDLGSGAFEPPERFGLGAEPTVAALVAAGADLVTFSGDKLVGGPQAGIVVGRSDAVRRLASAPMARAVRVDTLVIASLEPVLRSWARGRARDELPAMAALALPIADVHQRAEAINETLRARLGPAWTFAVVEAPARVGGGTQPLAEVPSAWLQIGHGALSTDRLESMLRRRDEPIIARAKGRHLLLDVRSLIAGSGGDDLATVIGDALADVAARVGPI